MTRTSCAIVLVVMSIGTGCGTSPAVPTAATSIPPQTTSPAAPLAAPLATLVIREFSVTEWYDRSQGRYHYWPKLTVAETSGVSLASIASITFELLDVGPTGRVPPASGPFVVPAGGTLTLVEDSYGYGPWLEIDSTADASRVSVVLSFLDSTGGRASVSAIAQVLR
jgi:hypothetical protein